jgi:hypothetical protein
MTVSEELVSQSVKRSRLVNELVRGLRELLPREAGSYGRGPFENIRGQESSAVERRYQATTNEERDRKN